MNDEGVLVIKTILMIDKKGNILEPIEKICYNIYLKNIKWGNYG